MKKIFVMMSLVLMSVAIASCNSDELEVNDSEVSSQEESLSCALNELRASLRLKGLTRGDQEQQHDMADTLYVVANDIDGAIDGAKVGSKVGGLWGGDSLAVCS